ncbi:MAG TPA: hypothetical protein PLW81_15310 [Thiobacillaceae bacterium]|nr:hypothetical protein [Thiobacillaceae bacterium]
MRKYQLTDEMQALVDQQTYERWLHRKAMAHVKRDKKRGNTSATVESYKIEIHKAVCHCKGKDAYTNEELNWSLLSKYDNDESMKHGRHYKKEFALLPSVDHVGDGKGEADFKICAWRTNDAKNDLSLNEFIELCAKVVKAANKANSADAPKARAAD